MSTDLEDPNPMNEARGTHLRGDALRDRCLTVLGRVPAAVVLDIDGTISEIAPAPDQAVVSDAARATLHQLRERVAVVAVITGRSAADGERLVGVDGLVYVGNHGLEQRTGGRQKIHPGAADTVQQIADALGDIEAALSDEGHDQGVIFENKILSASIHYRLAPEPEETGRRILALALATAESRDLRVTEGRLIVELRPNLAINKGTALADLVHAFQVAGLLFCGDDLTDVDGFQELKRMRERHQLDGLAIAVVAPEANPRIAQEADGSVESVGAMIQLLGDLAERLPIAGS
ncbi:MAG TPA: trehalose-phosphatase [Thermomicrobiales bacterium]|nr:trehalose-phosphatase [Thermomicrobiales bacterium]